MKITAVESILLTVPYRTSGGLQSIAGRPSAGLNMLLLRLDTDQGVTGWGEAFGHGVCPATKTAFDTLVAPMLIGRDPSGIDALMHDLQQTLHLFGRSGAVMYALSGVDIALWDIAGKVAGEPLYRLLGGTDRALPAYASLLRCSGPDTVASSCVRALDQGYRQIKLHEITVPAVQAAREAVGADVALMLDTNCPWSVDEALAMVAALRPFDLHWLEEPVWPPEDRAHLRQPRVIFRRPDRLLQPVQIERAQRRDHRERLIDAPRTVGVEHQGHVRPDGVARRLHGRDGDLVQLDLPVALLQRASAA